MSRHTRILAGLLGALLLPLPTLAHAQCVPVDGECPIDVPPWAGEFAALGVNATLGGLTAGVANALRGGDFSDGFVRGALGGALAYGGKRIAVERFDGAGFLGRQVAALGSSFVRNASDDTGLLDRLYVPLYLLRLEVRPRAQEGWRVRPRLDVATTVGTIYAIWEDELELDAGKSLSAGAFVFNTTGRAIKDDDNELGFTSGRASTGVILLSNVPGWPAEQRARTFAHERVHILQFDQMFAYWMDPLEDWLLDVVGASAVGQWADINALSGALGLLGMGLAHDDRPWELEAEWLER